MMFRKNYFYAKPLAMLLILVSLVTCAGALRVAKGGEEPLPSIFQGRYKVIFLAEDSEKLPLQAKNAIVLSLEKWQGVPPVDNTFAVIGLRWEKTWGLVTLAPYNPDDPKLRTTGHSFLNISALTAGLFVQVNDGWQSAIEGDPSVQSLLSNISNSQLSASARIALFPQKSWAANRATLPNQQYSGYKLPWRSGEDWRLTKGWHDNTNLNYFQSNHSLDFDIASLPNADVLTSASGQIIHQCRTASDNQTLIVIRTDNTSENLGYLHIDKNTSRFKQGDHVAQGQVLGRMVEGFVNGECGRSEGTHLHMYFPSKPFAMDAYTFDASSLPSGPLYSTNSPDNNPPRGDLGGTVRNSNNQPVPNAVVSIPSLMSTATTDSGGRYLFAGVLSGSREIQARSGNQAGSKTITIQPYTSNVADIILYAQCLLPIKAGDLPHDGCGGPTPTRTPVPPPNGCAGPTLRSPNSDAILNSQSITFSWYPVAGCSFNGYTMHVQDNPNMDASGEKIFDQGIGESYRVGDHYEVPVNNIDTRWNNRDLYWGVKAANASGGANWSVRRFRIEPSSGGNGDVTFCGNSVGCWNFPKATYPNLSVYTPNMNDQFERVIVGNGMSVFVFREANFRGQGDCYNNGTDRTLPNGGDYDLHRQLTSLQVFDMAEPCPDRNAPTSQMRFVVLTRQGNNAGPFFGMGDEEGLFNVDGSFNDKAIGVLIPDTWSVYLYEHADAQGQRYRVYLGVCAISAILASVKKCLRWRFSARLVAQYVFPARRVICA